MRAGLLLISIVTLAVLGLVPAAWAAQPEPWQLGLQAPASPVMAAINSLHDLLLWIITLISLLVLALLAYTCLRFRADRNPVPSRRSHNTLLEVVWTAVPVLILVIIAIPSFKLLYFQDDLPETELTVKAIGHQWYWTYEYPDHGNFTFDAIMVTDADLKPGQPRLLETDNRVVLPVDTNIRIQVTADDVLHSWAMPSLGVKTDAIPGRLNETWIRIEKPGVYYGQCSELCGDLHGFMPIAIEAVGKEEFAAWVEQAQARFAPAGEERVKVAGRISADTGQAAR